MSIGYQYHMIRESTCSELASEIQSLHETGWMLIGSPVFGVELGQDHGVFCQLMKKTKVIQGKSK